MTEAIGRTGNDLAVTLGERIDDGSVDAKDWRGLRAAEICLKLPRRRCRIVGLTGSLN